MPAIGRDRAVGSARPCREVDRPREIEIAALRIDGPGGQLGGEGPAGSVHVGYARVEHGAGGVERRKTLLVYSCNSDDQRTSSPPKEDRGL